MSHASRVDFSQQFKRHILEGLSVADFVNQHAQRIAKDSDYLVMIAAESCLQAKHPEHIERLFHQLSNVENPKYKTSLICKGFEFLAPRNQNHPEVLNPWYLHLASPNASEYTMQLGKTWKNLSKLQKHHAFLHYMSITPTECRKHMESNVLACVNKQVCGHPQLFIDVIPKLTHVSSASKLESYKNQSLSKYEKPGVLDTILSSLEPVDQTTFFIHFCSKTYYARNNKNFTEDVKVIHKYWENIMPTLYRYMANINDPLSYPANAILRHQLRPGILLIATVAHHYLHHTVSPDIDASLNMHGQISLYFKPEGLPSNFEHHGKGLMEEIANKLQSLRILQQVDVPSVFKVRKM